MFARIWKIGTLEHPLENSINAFQKSIVEVSYYTAVGILGVYLK